MTLIRGVKYDVILEDTTPLPQLPYKAPPDKQAVLGRHIEKEVHLGTLQRKPGGRYLSPVIVVDIGKRGKPDGRLCCDYRKINRKTRPAFFPMPPLWETLRRISTAKFKSTQDAVSGFNQVGLTDRAKEALMIACHLGTFEWQVLPFGPMNGPQNLQQVMQRKFEPCSQELAIFVDDMMLFA